MPKIWIIASIGHCATKWLTTVLADQPGIYAAHEYKQTSSGMDWVKAAKYEARYGVGGPKYKDYFEALSNAQYEVVADANSWNPFTLPEINDILPLDKVFYIIRHGVSQLHSLYSSSAMWREAPRSAFVYNRYLRPFYKGSDDEFTTTTQWERLCWFWQTNALMPGWLTKQGLPVEAVTFEELTQRSGLSKVLPEIDQGKIAKWQRQNINRHVRGDRRPQTLWEKWSVDQRDTFARVCREGMELYGYQTPSGADHATTVSEHGREP